MSARLGAAAEDSRTRLADGIVEAASVKGAAGFALGVQWHPEYKASVNPDSVKLFEAFGPTDPLTVSARRRLSSILFS